MRRSARLLLHLGAGALTALGLGCASAAAPYAGPRPLPPQAALTDKTAQVTQPPDRGAGPVRLAGGSTTAVAAKPHLPDALGPDAAVQFALENNPSLLAIREQRGFAQGGVVIARTYPYNPTLLVYETGANGPPSAGVTNHAFTEAIGRLDLEVRGQGKHRMATARAVLTRTEWEIAAQELIVSIATARAFDTVLYRQRKLEVLEDTIKFNEQVVERVKALADLGRLRPADLILARTELDTARAALGQGKTALAQARAALRQQFGTLDDSFAVRGELDLPVPTTEFDVYAQVALEQRPDVQVRRAAAEEARARARLQRADRFGNPSVGPFFELNETNVAFVGAALFAPIPVLNTRRGEIMQAEALAARAQAEVRQFEIQSAQDVQAALARLTEARKWVESYTGTVLPNLRKAVEDTNKLFEQNDPGADVLRVIGVQRNYLRALDASYDALFELSQARADLAAAVGDPNLALGRYPAPAKGK